MAHDFVSVSLFAHAHTKRAQTHSQALQTALATANTLLAATAKDTKAAALAATAAAGTAKTAVDAAKLNKVALEANVKLVRAIPANVFILIQRCLCTRCRGHT